MSTPTNFSTLAELRVLVRARCVESYEYFVEHAAPMRASQEELRLLWKCVVQGAQVEGMVSETFTWLFPELTSGERRAA